MVLAPQDGLSVFCSSDWNRLLQTFGWRKQRKWWRSLTFRTGIDRWWRTLLKERITWWHFSTKEQSSGYRSSQVAHIQGWSNQDHFVISHKHNNHYCTISTPWFNLLYHIYSYCLFVNTSYLYIWTFNTAGIIIIVNKIGCLHCGKAI